MIINSFPKTSLVVVVVGHDKDESYTPVCSFWLSETSLDFHQATMTKPAQQTETLTGHVN